MRPPCVFVRTAPCLLKRFLARISGMLLLLCLTGVTNYLAAEEKVSLEQMPPAVRSGAAVLTGRYNPDQMLRLVFALKPPHMEEEEQFLRELQDPASPQFHKYLSEQEWNQRFAPSADDEQAVVAWAQSQGLTITQRYANRLLVDVEAPSAVIEQALGVTMNSYQIGADAYFSNDRDPSLPAHLIGVVHSVMGLNNIQVAHSFSKLATRMRAPDYSPGPVSALGPHRQGDGHPEKLREAMKAGGVRGDGGFGQYGYTPANVYTSYAYNYNGLHTVGACCNPLNHPHGAPPEASIAVAIWGDYQDYDFSVFLGSFSYLAHDVERHYIDGTPRCCYAETTMDVEWATAMSNSFHSSADTAKVHMYEAASDSTSGLLDVLNSILRDNQTRIVSMSWGGAENYVFSSHDMDSYHAVFNQLLGQGWTLVASAGDGGATSDCADHLAVSFPASDPDVTAVGGTTLDLNPDGTYHMETGWAGSTQGCSNNDGGSGGGCSAQFAAPSYQSHPACGSRSRSVPDISLNADWVNTPQSVFFGGSWVGDGGTSIAAPEMAGFFAQENAYLLHIQRMVGETCGSSGSAPCAPMGSANPYLYYEGLHPFSPHYPFYDITYGCNGNDITRQYHLSPFCSVRGYDQVTGWGTPNMMQLAWTINDFLAGDGAGPSIAISGPPINSWIVSAETVSWSLTDTSGNGHLPIGVVGSNIAWDQDPGDPYSESTPGAGNAYYVPPFLGPTGSANVPSYQSTGCHSAVVRAWDNAGQSQLATYGPLCFDKTPPVTTIALTGNLQSPGNYIGPVQATLTATDVGSGVAFTEWGLSGYGPFHVYTSPLAFWKPGSTRLFAWSEDNVGNIETAPSVTFTILSNTLYLLQMVKRGTGTGTVTSADGGINCGSHCAHHLYDGQPMALTATPDPGSVFTGWRGCDISYGYSCVVTLAADHIVYATFNVPTALQFVPVAPCRVADTRWATGPLGGPSLPANTPRSFPVPTSACNIPTTAAAYSVNVTAVPQGFLGALSIWPSGWDRPGSSVMNSWDGRIKANAAIVPAGDSGAVSLYASSTTDVALDINGYFVPAPDSSALAFYPLAPCRVADTRWPNGPLGGPTLPAQQQRDLPVLSSQCGIPATAKAYSMNFTAVPKTSAPLWVVNAWPDGESQPNTSVLNAPTATVVANAAIVPAGNNGDIDVWASGDTDLVVDINGYFATPVPGDGGLSLYSNVTCRSLDTRNTIGIFSGLLAVDVVGSNCGVPQAAQAYVLNATLVPDGPVWLLTLWPNGNQPNASTLNAWDGQVTSNMAIVPASNGSIDAYAAGLADLVLDISSYFAP